MEGPRINTIDKDKEQFTQERQKLLIESQMFKLGQPAKGIVCIDLLESMYQVLIFSYHVLRDDVKPDSKEFIYEMTKFRNDIIGFTKSHGTDSADTIINNLEYKKLVNRFNDLVYMLYEIKSKIGMS